MTVTLENLMAKAEKDVAYSYSERDSTLYAMAIGMGRDPLDDAELDFVYERSGRLRCVPTQSITVARHNLIYDIGLNIDKLLHAEQAVMLHKPLPTSGKLLADQRVVSVVDKGPDKGILIETESRVRLADDGTRLFDLHDLFLARGDGGMGSSGRLAMSGHTMPDRAPDMVRSMQTEPWQALLYRIAVGDRGGVHAESSVAQQAGFLRPILHGSCTLAIACRQILAGVCEYDVTRMGSFGARFTAAVYPGERLEMHIWVDGQAVSFRCLVPERNTTVLDHGRVHINS